MSGEQPYIPYRNSFKRQKLECWLDTSLGQMLMQSEQQYVNQTVARLFGYHLLQLGNMGANHLFHESRIKHKMVVDLYHSPISDPYTHLQADAEALPFQSDSLDVVLLPHTLDFSDEPHQILREVERVLIGEGHVLIIGFNPWSVWGICKRLLAWRDQSPWEGHFFSQSRIRDWLELLGFELLKSESFFFRPPLQGTSLMKRLGIIEKLGMVVAPFFGAVYLILAKKKVISLTPVKMQWKTRRHKIASEVVEPNTRNSRESSKL